MGKPPCPMSARIGIKASSEAGIVATYLINGNNIESVRVNIEFQ